VGDLARVTPRAPLGGVARPHAGPRKSPMHRRSCPKRSPVSPALLAARAHAFRASATISERRIWEAIRAKKLAVEFRRQVPVAGKYIADFVAPEVALIVEIDGEYHARQRCADARRDERLRRLGYRVLRLEAGMVMRDLPAALARIVAEVATLRRREVWR
jgi:very-short-patch-repair endonuclease